MMVPSDPEVEGDARGIGLFALVGSVVLTYFFVYRPYTEALLHSRETSVNFQAVGAIPLVFRFGFLHGLFPAFSSRHFGPVNAPRRLWWWISGILVALGFLLCFWLHQQLAENGHAA